MKKPYLILLGVFLLVLIVWWFERPDKPDVGDFQSFVLYPKLEDERAARIEIEHLVNGILLEAETLGWSVSDMETDLAKETKEAEGGSDAKEKIEKYSADGEKIQALIDSLAKLEARSLVSTNPEKQPVYQVNELAKRVKIYNGKGKKIVDLFVGKNGPEMFSEYVRRDGENEVYLTNMQVGAKAPVEVEKWRNMLIWNIPPDSITKIRIDLPQKPQDSFLVVKDGNRRWKMTSPEERPVSSKEVGEFLSQVAELKAVRFSPVTSTAETGLDKPILEISLTTNSGTTPRLVIGGEDSEGYLYAFVDGGNGIFLLSAKYHKGLAKELNDVVSKEAKDTPDTPQDGPEEDQ